jgi:Translation initiation factor eIF3 subunit 135
MPVEYFEVASVDGQLVPFFTFIRPELAFSYTEEVLDDNWREVKTKEPVKCN